MWIENYGDAEWILTDEDGPLGFFATEEEALAYQKELEDNARSNTK